MKRRYQKKADSRVKIAKEHIFSLLKQAKEVYSEDPKLADRYVRLARKTAMKFKIKLSPAQRKFYCKHCYSFLMPGKSVRIRIHKSQVIYYCLKCRKYMRFPVKKRRK